jgi:hypothetical protein
MFTWTTRWHGMMLLENILIPNEWEIKVAFNGEYDDPDQEQIAFDRCKFLIDVAYQEALFMRVDEETFSKLHDKVLCHKITLPDEAIDSTIAIATLSKFISITEGRLSFDGISISSRISEGIEFYFDSSMLKDVHWLNDNPVRKLTGESAWFMRSDAGSTDIWLQSKKKHEILRDVDDWKNHGLDWEQTEMPNPTENLVAPPVHKPTIKKGWKPKIIDGGKV